MKDSISIIVKIRFQIGDQFFDTPEAAVLYINEKLGGVLTSEEQEALNLAYDITTKGNEEKEKLLSESQS